MKKLLGIAVLAVALSGLMSCASKEAKPAGLPHPRSYTIDVADGTGKATGAAGAAKLVFNQYGPNFQEEIDFTSFVKFNKPLAGDTVDVTLKGVADNDVAMLVVNIVDTSAAYSYWGVLNANADSYFIENIVAGQPFEATFSMPLEKDMKGNFKIVLRSDESNGDIPITWEKVTNTTDTSTEVVIEERVPQVYDMDFTKYAAFLEVKTNHPWINGVQDMSQISNYEATVDITNFFPSGDKLPIAGDKLNITWKVTSDTDIAKLCMRVIENTPAVNWWKELDKLWLETQTGLVVAENIKAGEVLDISASFDFAEASVEGASIVIWYDVGDADRPAIFKLVRD